GADARIEHALFEGEPAPDQLVGFNVFNAVDFESIVGSDPQPISGSLEVREATFRQLASGVPVENANADVRIVHNLFDGTLLGGELNDLVDSRYVFADNDVRPVGPGFDEYNLCLGPSSPCGLVRSSILVAGNRFDGGPIVLEGSFHEDVRCRVRENEFSDLPDDGLELFLGPGTHDCRVNDVSNYIDQGTNNEFVP